MEATSSSSSAETYQSTPSLAMTRSATTEAPGAGKPGQVRGGGARTATRQAPLVVDMQEGPGPRHRSTLSTAAHKRLTETINGVSDHAARSGMAVIYAHQAPGRATQVLSPPRTGGDSEEGRVWEGWASACESR